MAATIMSNKPRTSAVIHVAGANATFIVPGANGASDLAAPGETLTGAYITQAVWGCDPNCFITIKRGVS